MSLDHQDQRNLLDQQHAGQQAAVVVAEFMAFQRQPGSEFTVTFLESEARETLLPKTDRIRFVDANQSSA